MDEAPAFDPLGLIGFSGKGAGETRQRCVGIGSPPVINEVVCEGVWYNRA